MDEFLLFFLLEMSLVLGPFKNKASPLITAHPTPS